MKQFTSVSQIVPTAEKITGASIKTAPFTIPACDNPKMHGSYGFTPDSRHIVIVDGGGDQYVAPNIQTTLQDLEHHGYEPLGDLNTKHGHDYIRSRPNALST